MRNKETIEKILSRFPTLRIAVIGDYFLDRYWDIDPVLDESSIETGLTAQQVVRCRYAPGAAGTVVNNLAALGVGKIFAAGFTGNDGEGYVLRKKLGNIGVNQQFLLETPHRQTPCYTKPLRNGIEGNRFDIKNRTKTPPDVEERIAESLRLLAGRVDAIMIMDQVSEEDSGVITDSVRNELICLGSKADSPLIYADSRERIGLFRNILVKCNDKELLNVFGKIPSGNITIDELKGYGVKLSEKTKKTVFVTLGANGQLVVNADETVHVPAVPVSGEIDICGAGDSASAGIVASLCSGAGPAEAAYIGNVIASITIRQLGCTGTATPEEVLKCAVDC
ncbi:MAG: PfkB family carbohydrate kinase [Planctomycetaceae bacterium]|jgi:rfaE bifunctional protein kinase chain/domain|nr:PfkB family carbohydrate kinase [Planctomycetaceae bacterium]